MKYYNLTVSEEHLRLIGNAIEGIHNHMGFGKYSDKTILEVLMKDPSYLVWCVRNVNGFSLNEKLSDELCRQYDEHFRKYSRAKAEEYDVRALMGKPYCMHVTEAMNYLDYDEF